MCVGPPLSKLSSFVALKQFLSRNAAVLLRCAAGEKFRAPPPFQGTPEELQAFKRHCASPLSFSDENLHCDSPKCLETAGSHCEVRRRELAVMKRLDDARVLVAGTKDAACDEKYRNKVKRAWRNKVVEITDENLWNSMKSEYFQIELPTRVSAVFTFSCLTFVE